MPTKRQVVVLTRQRPKPRRQRRNKRVQMIVQQKRAKPIPGISGLATDRAVRQFQMALRNPFSPDALGVRVIDSVCYPTTVSHLRFKVSCQTTAAGTFQAVILPFLHANMILNAGTTIGSPGVYPLNTAVSYAALQTDIRAFFSNYRIVTWGARVILTDANQTAKGVFTAAPVLLAGPVPGEDILGGAAATTTERILDAFSLPTPTEAIASMPGAVAVNAQDLMQRGELTMRGLAYSVTAYNMKSIRPLSNWSVNTAVGTVPYLVDLANNDFQHFETSSAYSGDGQLGYLLSVSGAPPSTSEFSLEFIYHIEGVPRPTSSVVMTSTPSPAGGTSTVERVLAAMTSAGDYFAMGTSVLDRLGKLGTQMYTFRNRARLLMR